MGTPPAAVTSLSALSSYIYGHPLIDNHAHPLLLPSHTTLYPLESITSEAHGRALTEHSNSLAHFRAIRFLSSWLGCAESWEAIKAARAALDHEQWSRRCLAGVQAVLLDDGLDAEGEVESVAAHERFLMAAAAGKGEGGRGVRRIVRIERVAEQVLAGLFAKSPELRQAASASASASISRSTSTSTSASASASTLKAEGGSNGVGGGAGSSHQLVPGTAFIKSLFFRWADAWKSSLVQALADPFVVGFKSVICYRSGLEVQELPEAASPLLEAALVRMVEAARKSQWTKWRVDDKVLNDYLVLALFRLIRSLPEGKRKPVQFHCGLGDVDLRLEKANPVLLEWLIKKYAEVPIVLLHSAYPFVREAGYLATNYAHVYLDFGEVFPLLSHDGQKSVVKQMLELTPATKLLWSSDGHWFPEMYALANAQIREVLIEVLTKRVRTGRISLDQAVFLTSHLFFHNSNALYKLGLTPYFSSTYSPPPLPAPSAPLIPEHSNGFEKFLAAHPETRFIRLQWVDYTALRRLRLVPVASMRKLASTGGHLAITKAAFSLLQNDGPSSDQTVVGQWFLNPDWSSLRSCSGHIPGHATVNCALLCDSPNKLAEVPMCPRTALRAALQHAQTAHGITLLAGVESEVVFLSAGTLEALPGAHAWSTAALTPQVTACLDAVADALAVGGVSVSYLHAEAAQGQFEVVTDPLSPLAAVDALYFTRETLEAVACRFGFRATLHPKPWSDLTGTAAHVHISLVTGREKQGAFFAGVLNHLPTLVALGMPTMASYERLKDGCWAGGTWNSWGHQNRETPLRRIDEGEAHWEIRCVDGTANMFLVMAAIIRAGIDGVDQGLELPQACDVNPASLSTEQRTEVGITERLPLSLPEALEALIADTRMTELLGKPVVGKFISIKGGELELMKPMSAAARWRFMVERY